MNSKSSPAIEFDPEIQEHYQREGYVVARGVPADLIDLGETIAKNWVETKVREWIDEGILTSDFLDLPLKQRFMSAWLAAGKPTYNRDSRHYLCTEELYRYLTHPYLVGLSEHLLGSKEVSVNGTYNLRLKHPQLPWSVVPWHADLYYWEEYRKGDFLNMIIFWIPFQPMSRDSGCLQVVPYNQGSGMDFQMKDGAIFIPDETAARFNPETIEMKRGEVLCMSDTVIHRSLPNTVSEVVWNLDVRYEQTSEKGTSAKNHGFVVSTESTSATLTTASEWVAKRQPKIQVAYSNKQ